MNISMFYLKTKSLVSKNVLYLATNLWSTYYTIHKNI